MYLHEFTARNYMIHRNTRLTLSPITVLVGPNGGGKSSLFDAILNFSMLARGSLRQAFGHYPYSYAATKCRHAANFERVGFEVEMSATRAADQRLRYEINYSQKGFAEPNNPAFDIAQEYLADSAGAVLFDRNNPAQSPLTAAKGFVGDDYGILAATRKAVLEGRAAEHQAVADCAKEIGRFNRFRLAPNELSRPSRMPETSEASAPRLGYEGEDLASCLYYMSETEDPALAQITDEVRGLLPEFDGFEFNVVGVDRVAFSMKFSDGRGSINAARMSHGNLIFLGLMVLTYSQNRPPVMLIEEPENGLTPAALKRFYDAARRLALRPEQEQPSQVLISSHSPFVICEAWNGNDRDFIHQITVRDGICVARPLSEVIAENRIVTAADGRLGLRNAEELMCGYYS